MTWIIMLSLGTMCCNISGIQPYMYRQSLFILHLYSTSLNNLTVLNFSILFAMGKQEYLMGHEKKYDVWWSKHDG